MRPPLHERLIVQFSGQRQGLAQVNQWLAQVVNRPLRRQHSGLVHGAQSGAHGVVQGGLERLACSMRGVVEQGVNIRVKGDGGSHR